MFRETIPWEKVIAVTNRHLCRGDFFHQIEKIGENQVRGLILREKDLSEPEYLEMAERVLAICKKQNVPCMLHTFWKTAEELGWRRIHLPLSVLEEMPAEEKENFDCIGVSVHSREQALKAVSLGADYLTAGHIFPTDCKKGLAPRGIDFLKNICQTVQVPVFGIGGIHPGNIGQVLDAGASGVCMMSEMMNF